MCAEDQTYSTATNSLFPDVQTRFGVSNASMSVFRSAGKLTFENAGLFLISGIFVMTDTNGYLQIYLSKNGHVTRRLFFSVTTGHNYQTGTIAILYYSNKHDTLDLQPITTIRVVGPTHSCIFLL